MMKFNNNLNLYNNVFAKKIKLKITQHKREISLVIIIVQIKGNKSILPIKF